MSKTNSSFRHCFVFSRPLLNSKTLIEPSDLQLRITGSRTTSGMQSLVELAKNIYTELSILKRNVGVLLTSLSTLSEILKDG